MNARKPSNLSIVRPTVPTTPLDALHEQVKASASGELICAAPSCEIHVYLQAGRVAWATDSTQPFAFSRYLLEHTSLTKETLQEVLESCRRDRLPLGETLVAWKVVTLDEIRGALHHQIEGAIDSLEKCAKGRTLFLERTKQYASYDARLTFDLHELLSPTTAVRPVLKESAIVTGVLDKIRGSIPPPAWLALVEGEVVLDRQPSGFEDLLPSHVFGHTVMDGADLVALRTARGTVVGVALPETDRTVWCRLEVETALGTTLAGLNQHARVSTPPASLSSPPQIGEPIAVRTVVSADQAGVEVIRGFMERAPEVDAVLIDDAGTIASAAARRDVDASWMQNTVRRRTPVLQLIDNGPVAEVEEMGYRLKSMVTGEGTMWCFGAQLASRPGRTVWLFTTRDTAQGLGWAYLTSLCRQIDGIPA